MRHERPAIRNNSRRHFGIPCERSWRGWLARLPVLGPLAAGAAALAWILFRSGAKPSRISYPCQQAAFSVASLAFGAPLVAALVALRRRVVGSRIPLQGIALTVLALTAGAVLWISFPGADPALRPAPFAQAFGSSPSSLALPAPGTVRADDYRASVFHVANCLHAPVGDRFPGLDDLLEVMGAHGLKLYRSPTTSIVAGPDGIIAADDVVVIKINYQWAERGGTNTDLLRGLIARIVEHPDTFTGEVVVCENAQFNSTQNLDRTQNNSEYPHLSPRDVVLHFQSLGYKVSTYDWTPIRYTQVGEYSTGDTADGYIVYPYDTQLQGRISYPKFRTSYGTRSA